MHYLFPSTPARPNTLSRPLRAGFTVVEFLVLIGIIVVILSIFIPYLLKARETSRRAVCSDHLRQIGFALNHYASWNEHAYPRTAYDPAVRPTGYAAFTAPDAQEPFDPDAGPQPSDVTASLWLLVRLGYFSQDPSLPGAVFICPSTSDTEDPAQPIGGKGLVLNRSNFRSGRHLSYSYCNPFSSARAFASPTSSPRTS